MDELAKHIERTLKELGFCVVFEDELQCCWPRDKIKPAERERQIHAFAKSHGWIVSILNTDSGVIRALFSEDQLYWLSHVAAARSVLSTCG